MPSNPKAPWCVDFEVRAHDPQDDECANALQRLIEENFEDIKGSFYDHAQDYANSNRKAWIDQYICNPWAGPIKEKTMKPGPYKSSTHGNIALSLRGRELLMELRNQTSGKIAEAARTGLQPWKEGDQLSHARGELAAYMSYLETRAGLRFSERNLPGAQLNANPLRLARFPWRSFEFHGFDESSDFNPLRYKKETPVTEPTEKTRSQLIGEATHELVQAQQALEYIEKSPADAADRMSLGIPGSGILAEGVQTLVREQFDALRKKVTARAKARVAKAEKAVAALLAG